MIATTGLNITLYVHCLSCLSLKKAVMINVLWSVQCVSTNADRCDACHSTNSELPFPAQSRWNIHKSTDAGDKTVQLWWSSTNGSHDLSFSQGLRSREKLRYQSFAGIWASIIRITGWTGIGRKSCYRQAGAYLPICTACSRAPLNKYIVLGEFAVFMRQVFNLANPSTTRFYTHNYTFRPHSVFVCFVWISEQTAIISLYHIFLTCFYKSDLTL
jgi:hypothetical protein